MIKYYCDRCGKEIDKEDYETAPIIYKFRKVNTRYVVINDICKLCYPCMNEYVSFLNGKDIKEVK